MKLRVLAALVAVSVVAVAPAQASLVTVQIEYTDTEVTGTALATFEEALLDLGLTEESPPSSLADFSMTILGLDGAGSSTTFNESHLTGWLLNATGGTIKDINFFMMDGGTNADGFSIQGVEPFLIGVCRGRVVSWECVQPNGLTVPTALNGDYGYEVVLQGEVTNITPVPEPVTLFLLGAGLAGVIARRRK